jgi:Flp pilus assembly CpaE family ATPase
MVADAYPQISVCPHHLTQLDIYGTSQDIGKSVFDDDPHDRAAEAISQTHKLELRHVENRKSAKRA